MIKFETVNLLLHNVCHPDYYYEPIDTLFNSLETTVNIQKKLHRFDLLVPSTTLMESIWVMSVLLWLNPSPHGDGTLLKELNINLFF